jgi:hypothetical protein
MPHAGDLAWYAQTLFYLAWTVVGVIAAWKIARWL